MNPFEYLRDVFERVAMHPRSGIDVLLPPNWQAAHRMLASEPSAQHAAPEALAPASF